MESRFGYDFSSVRIYTGERAALSANSIDALAYTVGNDIVFGRDQYNPSTRGGRTLLAHELAHVAQQARHQGALRIQRKEILASRYGAGRYRHGVADIAPEDWTEPDREEWEALSASGNEQMLSPGNTFMRAAWYNTLNMRPGEYQTIRERHDYYDLISYAIQHDPGTPKAVRDVRFFHATTAVTGHPGIGSVETTTGLGKLGAETRQILREVNAELFALNMGIIRNLLSNWKEPRDPQNPAGPIKAFDFDIRMVETEQGTVENYITRNKARFTPSVVQDINATMDPTSFGQFFNFSHYSFEWAIEALGLPFLQSRALDFTKREHRQAIGFASVHIFHRKSKQDYLAFMKQRVPYVRPLEGATLDVWKSEDDIRAKIEAEIIRQLRIAMKGEDPRAIAHSRLLVNLFSKLGLWAELYYERINARRQDDELVNLLYSRIDRETRARIFKVLGIEQIRRMTRITN